MDKLIAQNATSPMKQSGWDEWPPAPALPRAWIARVFSRLQGRFGQQFVGKYASGQTDDSGADSGVENAMRVWAEELAGMTGEEIAAGLSARYQYPPSLDEFQAVCRPPFDYAGAYAEAQLGMQKRDNSESHQWSSKAVYWAAVEFGCFELRNQGWTQAEKRWTRLVNQYLSNPALADIPPVVPALPKPIDRNGAERHLAKLYAIVGGKPADSKDGLRKIL